VLARAGELCHANLISLLDTSDMTGTNHTRDGGTAGITKIASDLVDIHLENPAIATRYADSDIPAHRDEHISDKVHGCP